MEERTTHAAAVRHILNDRFIPTDAIVGLTVDEMGRMQYPSKLVQSGLASTVEVKAFDRFTSTVLEIGHGPKYWHDHCDLGRPGQRY